MFGGIDWLALLGALWPFIVGGGLGVVALYFYNKYTADEDTKYKRYYDLVIGAVKLAEKAIPDNAKNKTARKADEFMKAFVTSVEANDGVKPSDALKKWANRVKERVLLRLDEFKKPPAPPEAPKKKTTNK